MGLTAASVNVCLEYWGETVRSRLPDSEKVTTRALNPYQAEDLKKQGWQQDRSGLFVKVAPIRDVGCGRVMYPRHAPGDGVRLRDDPHPGAFVYLQVEACLAQFDGPSGNPHRAWALRRFVNERPDSSNEDRRLGRQVRKTLAEMIESGDHVSRQDFSIWLALERRLRTREAAAARARAFRERSNAGSTVEV